MEKKCKSTYLIGEIGQNHNGSFELAKQIIDLAAMPVREKLFDLPVKGMDAVKFTKRDLTQELSASEMKKPYLSPNSFGKTYGEHRKALELSDEQHFALFKYAKLKNLDFVETLCSPSCLSLLKYFEPNKLKVASRDLTNLPLLEALAETKIPIILSTGMTGKQELDEALEVITRIHSKISILHCVSEYPTHPQHVNLRSLDYLLKNYGEYSIGYSDHTIGISVPVAAVAKGAQIIEKHITIDRSMKGTDQKGSLGIDGVRRMVRDIRLMEMALGREDIFIQDAVQAVRNKLERSLATNRTIMKGEIMLEEDIHLLSPGTGYKWNERFRIIGKKTSQIIYKDEIILPGHIS
ncbi:N-acetylneuraminate synthase family protein [Salegentibacter salegens]|uniref:Sialic acid synthase n=1 Tax=Salegentibacter salegens TaxID=143223 RepID=A0A1M7HE16_9FLAO|nr:N-acetylneuraminate synthase family protein [Salegentibacter salegens]PRX43487.1 sialic acid synthase [Salegentibacter salegens]SHM26699.1 sialic acid synthase [Salegentibacter salegens]